MCEVEDQRVLFAVAEESQVLLLVLPGQEESGRKKEEAGCTVLSFTPIHSEARSPHSRTQPCGSCGVGISVFLLFLS